MFINFFYWKECFSSINHPRSYKQATQVPLVSLWLQIYPDQQIGLLYYTFFSLQQLKETRILLERLLIYTINSDCHTYIFLLIPNDVSDSHKTSAGIAPKKTQLFRRHQQISIISWVDFFPCHLLHQPCCFLSTDTDLMSQSQFYLSAGSRRQREEILMFP